MSEKRCENCSYFQDDECFFSPPKVYTDPDTLEMSYHRPRLHGDSWCSKFANCPVFWSCEQCEFFDKMFMGEGNCCVGPPELSLGRPKGEFPEVCASDFCSKFLEKRRITNE